MTEDRPPTQWRREELARPARTFRLPWLALAGVAATIIAASTLVVTIGDTLSSRDRSAGSLLPLQAASPSATAPPSTPEPPPPTPEPSPPETPDPPRSETPDPPMAAPMADIHDALLKLRRSVDQGVAVGDVRDDVGLDLTNVIEGMLDEGRGPRRRARANITYLQNKIATRTREGGISDDRAEELHLILDRATP
ncbi:hypothetical protein [Spirillospora sp. CA-128828]|uniref:hypothetical protein n=1 Tax=Spirillospora sp. CA-128828 TaxID=3240033 RepID=UPI003D8AAE6A